MPLPVAGRPWNRLGAYFSEPWPAVRRASSSERRMSMAMVASFLPDPDLSSCSMTRTSVSDSDGMLTDVVAVGLSPFKV